MNINSVFHTFQGEGANAGRRALFVRMPFCNLKCSWCDTEFNTYKSWTEDELTEFANRERCRFAVVTGGEPMMNKDTPKVVGILKGLGFTVATETNGTFKIVDGVDWVTVSPKPGANYCVDSDAWNRADEFKYVIDQGFDMMILERDYPASARLFLSPEFTDFKKNLEKIFAFIKKNPRWRISLQTHKWMEIL